MKYNKNVPLAYDADAELNSEDIIEQISQKIKINNIVEDALNDQTLKYHKYIPLAFDIDNEFDDNTDNTDVTDNIFDDYETSVHNVLFDTVLNLQNKNISVAKMIFINNIVKLDTNYSLDNFGTLVPTDKKTNLSFMSYIINEFNKNNSKFKIRREIKALDDMIMKDIKIYKIIRLDSISLFWAFKLDNLYKLYLDNNSKNIQAFNDLQHLIYSNRNLITP